MTDKPTFFSVKSRNKLDGFGAEREPDGFNLEIRLASPNRKASKLAIFKATIVLFGVKQIKTYRFSNLKVGQTLSHPSLEDISFKVVKARKGCIKLELSGSHKKIYRIYLKKGEEKIKPTAWGRWGYKAPYTYEFTGRKVSGNMTLVVKIPEGEFEIPVNIEFKDIELP